MSSDNLIPFSPRMAIMAGTLVPLCTQYLMHLQTRGYARNTVQAYRCDLEQFVGFAQTQDVTVIQVVSQQLVDDWITTLIDGHGVSRRTAARKLESLRQFIRYCIGRAVIRKDVTTEIKIRFITAHVIAPSEAELMKVINSIPTDTTLGLRDKALFRLLFDSAMRVGGVISLNVYNAATPSTYMVEPNGLVGYCAKGGKRKTTVVDDATLDLLAQWMAVRHEFDTQFGEALFVSKRGERMTRQTIAARLKLYGALAGVPHIHCHLFRHRRLGEVYEKTGDLRIAADMGGHQNMRTFAEIYGMQTAEVRRHKIRTMAPLGGADTAAKTARAG